MFQRIRAVAHYFLLGWIYVSYGIWSFSVRQTRAAGDAVVVCVCVVVEPFVHTGGLPDEAKVHANRVGGGNDSTPGTMSSLEVFAIAGNPMSGSLPTHLGRWWPSTMTQKLSQNRKSV
jgi:hypothetical protein